MAHSNYLTPAPPSYLWPRCPEADQFIRDRIEEFLKGHVFAHDLAVRMRNETSTEFISWVDHLFLPKNNFDVDDLEKRFGFVEENKVKGSPGDLFLSHPFADLPRLILSSKAKNISCAIHVERISYFQSAHDLSFPIEGTPYSNYRVMRMTEGKSDLLVLERRGTKNYSPGKKPSATDYLQALELLMNRPRRFATKSKGINYTLSLAKKVAKKLGTGAAATAFLEAERMYWQKRNRAGQIQFQRQEKLGLGWANHDQHTFRSSRATFAALIKILLAFGFKKRERYYAGSESGWGAQIMEQPEAGLVIFADVDLSPKDISIDFSIKTLPELEKYRTVGLWCALHGESILEAGLHHLEAQFDFDLLKMDLAKEQIGVMSPFSDFSYLRQAFTKGEQWHVPSERLEQLKRTGKISPEAYEEMKVKGAVGSHLENLQRREGFKGFNQKGVSVIIHEVNPERQALSHGDQRITSL